MSKPPQGKMTKKQWLKFNEGRNRTHIEGTLDRTDGRRTRVGQSNGGSGGAPNANPKVRRIRW
jgi:hypothetical protein